MRVLRIWGVRIMWLNHPWPPVAWNGKFIPPKKNMETWLGDWGMVLELALFGKPTSNPLENHDTEIWNIMKSPWIFGVALKMGVPQVIIHCRLGFSRSKTHQRAWGTPLAPWKPPTFPTGCPSPGLPRPMAPVRSTIGPDEDTFTVLHVFFVLALSAGSGRILMARVLGCLGGETVETQHFF